MLKKTIKSTKLDRKYVKILGITIDSAPKPEVLTRVKNYLSHNTKFYIVTPNPELVLMAQTNSELKLALNSASIATPDGIGLVQAHKFLSLRSPKNLVIRFIVTFFQGITVGLSTFFNQKWLTNDIHIIKGRELFLDLVSLSADTGLKVFFLGGEGNEAEEAALKLKKRFKDLEIDTFKGPILDKNLNPVTEVDRKLNKDAIDRINKYSPDFLFVAMSNPKQEIWIHKNISKLNIKGAMAVGGTFRYIAGKSKLPPKWMASAGLEWVWRFITEPTRALRIFNAWPIFPFKIWSQKLGR